MEYNVNIFKELLLSENQKQNLISRRNPEMEINKHLEDSARVLDFVTLEGKRVIDVGSGAGFPGLILALLVSGAKFTLLESDQKKSGFLRSVQEKMKLVNVNIVNQRAEIAGQDVEYRSAFDICTSRAVASMRIVLEFCLPLVKPGGQVILWKGKNYSNEIQEAGNALQILGGQVAGVFNYTLMDQLDRSLVIVKKISPTPEKYPRRDGIPGKRPL